MYSSGVFLLEAMSNLRPTTTGVEGAVIWISAGEFDDVDAQLGPRIKVVLGSKLTAEGLKRAASVRLTSPPVVLGKLPGKVRKQATQFVEKNRDVLLRHWGGKLDSKKTLNLLEPIEAVVIFAFVDTVRRCTRKIADYAKERGATIVEMKPDYFIMSGDFNLLVSLLGYMKSNWPVGYVQGWTGRTLEEVQPHHG